MIKLIPTNDGSSSLYNDELNETYHSRHGALQESRYVFIEKGLKTLNIHGKTVILEVGMGTGLNVLLTALYAAEHDKQISLITLEPFPLEDDLLQGVNYAKLINNESAEKVFNAIHSAPWEEWTEINPNFSLKKIKKGLLSYSEFEEVDLIYYDAFGPHAQPKLWEKPVFDHLANFCKTNTVLVTYCAQGQFKRNLKSSGFSIERLPGPPGKREMTRGTFI